MLKADVWRDTLLREEASLNAKLGELEKEGDDKRFEDAREEAETRLAEVHARLAEMEAESGPARAAALLAGALSEIFAGSNAHLLFQVLDLVRLINQGQRDHSVEAGECDWHSPEPSSSR